MRVRLAVKGSDSTSITGSKEGYVIAAYPLDFDFGSEGEKTFVGLAMDLPDDHPLVTGLRSSLRAANGKKSRYRVDLAAVGLSAAVLLQIRNRSVRSPWHIDKLVSAALLIDQDSS